MHQRSAAAVSVTAAAVVGGAVALATILVKTQAIALALFAAVVIGEAARPLVDRLSARSPRSLAVALVFAGIVGLIALAWFIPIHTFAPQVVALWQSLLTSPINPRDVLASIPQSVSAQIGSIVQGLWSFESGLATSIGTIALVLLMAAFWLGASDALRNFLLTLVPPSRRERLDALFREMGSQLGIYVSGTLLNGAIVAAASTLALVWLHAPYPIVLGLLQGLLVAIPYVGTLIGVLTVGAVVFAAHGPPAAAGAMAAVAVIASCEGSFVAPLIFKKSLNIDPLSTTLAVAVGGTLFGIGGVILAVPAASVLQTVIVRALAPAIRSRFAER